MPPRLPPHGLEACRRRPRGREPRVKARGGSLRCSPRPATPSPATVGAVRADSSGGGAGGCRESAASEELRAEEEAELVWSWVLLSLLESAAGAEAAAEAAEAAAAAAVAQEE